MKSVLSNPVMAGIDAFAKISGVMSENENTSMRRKLVDQQLLESQQRTSQEQQKFGWAKDIHEDTVFAGHLAGAYLAGDQAQKEGKEPVYTGEQQQALIRAGVESPTVNLERLDDQAAATSYIKDFMQKNGPAIMQKGGILNREKYPEIFDAFDKVYGKQINKGTDQHGMAVEKDSIDKKINSAIIDPKDGTIAFTVRVDTPVKDGQVFKHIGDGAPKYTVEPDATGMKEVGNIDLSQRPVVRNGDGSVSTLRSMSFYVDGVGEVLIPTIGEDGKKLTDKEAIEQYRKTGKQLGIFESAADATAYAEHLHSDPMWNEDIKAYSAKGQEKTSYEAPVTADRGNRPDAPVLKIPVQMLSAHLNTNQTLINKLMQLRAKIDPGAFLKEVQAMELKTQESKAVKKALSGIDTSLSVIEQRRQALGNKPDMISTKDWADIVDKTFKVPAGSVMNAYQQWQMNRALQKDADAAAKPKTLMKGHLKTFYGPGGKTIEKFIEDGKDFDPDKEIGPGWSAVKPADAVMKTIYGPGGATKEVSIAKGKDYVPPKGWSLGKPEKTPSADSPARTRVLDARFRELDRSMLGYAKASLPKLEDPGYDMMAVEEAKKSKDLDVILSAIPEGKREQIRAIQERALELIEKKNMLPMKAMAQAKKEHEKPAQQGKVFNKMPPAAQHRGRIISDTGTGKRYKSDGVKWVEVK